MDGHGADLPRSRRGPRLGAAVLAAVLATLSAGLVVSRPSSSLAGTGAAQSARQARGTSGGGPGGVLRAGTLPARPGALPGGAGPAAEPPLPPTSVVTLLTGERVRLDVTPGGQQAVAPAPATGHGTEAATAQFTGFSWDGDRYLIPDEAIPYLGSVLDPRLFDVSYLVRAGLDDARSSGIPVTIGYAGGSRALRLPGTHVTRAVGDTASATISKAQAPRLGQLLASLWHPGSTPHPAAPLGAAGRLPGITRISLAPVPGAPPLPADPLQAPAANPVPGGGGKGIAYHTLTLRFTDLNGNPGLATGLIQNVGNLGLGLSYIAATQGSYQISVPQGTYSIGFNILTPHSATSGTPYRAALVAKPQITVDSDTTVTLDARTATPYRPAPATYPAADSGRFDMVSFTRSSAAGGAIGSQDAPGDLYLLSFAGKNGLLSGPLRATPTAPVTEGTFDFNAVTVLYDPSPSPGHSPPRYFLDFPHLGSIPAVLSPSVPGADLTSVHEQVYGSPSGASQSHEELWPDVYLPWGEAVELATGVGHGMYVWPGAHTDYWYSSAPRLTVWQGSFITDYGEQAWGRRWVISPGRRIVEPWNQAPLGPPPVAHPATFTELVGSPTTGALRTVCPACRQGDIGMLYLSPDGDADPFHYLSPVTATPAFSFYRDGRLAITSASLPRDDFGVIFPFALPLPMLPGPASYRLSWSVPVRTDPRAVVTTAWTFGSSPGGAAGGPPRTEECAPDPAQRCSFLPLLFLTYDLALNPHSQATADSPFRINFTVGYQQGEAPPPVAAATVSASFDNGRTWTTPRPATTAGGDRFTAIIRQPPLSDTTGFVSLRVTARDGTGNSVTQTIIKAYGLTR